MKQVMALVAIGLMLAPSLALAAGGAAMVTQATDRARIRLGEDGQGALMALQKKDPTLETEILSAAGYVIFAGVGKGGLGIGAARGTGQLYVKEEAIAKVTLTQVTIGLQLGGQKYIELVLLENQDALESFLASKFTMAAQVSAVAAASGASANAKYSGGVKVVTMAIGGLMYEASIGGQKFKVEKY